MKSEKTLDASKQASRQGHRIPKAADIHDPEFSPLDPVEVAILKELDDDPDGYYDRIIRVNSDSNAKSEVAEANDMGALSPDLAPVCRSTMIDGRRTSIRMEREFWEGLDVIRRQEQLSMQDVLNQAIDTDGETSKIAAIKAWVLAYYRKNSQRLH